ncbi:MAG: hypothetical protein ACXWKX_09570 [Caulobacteraceae bacterium]
MTAGRRLWAARPPLLLGLAIALLPAVVLAAGLSPADQADLRRAYAASALSTSEEPAVRAERALRVPSTGFMLGAALGAWTAARDQLDFDLKNPAAAGAPHASQGAANLDAIDQDCREEKTAFDRLESRSRALGLEPSGVLEAAGSKDPALARYWGARRSGGPSEACAAPP